MPRVIPESEYENLKKLLKAFPEGVSISELLRLPDIRISKRTLQRRLDSMCIAGLIHTQGKARALKYLPQEQTHSTAKSSTQEAPQNTTKPYRPDIPYSSEATQIKDSVTRPLTHRKKVGHKVEFLDYYQPNQSSYLNSALRQELASLGNLGTQNSPPGTYLRHNINNISVDLGWNSSRLEGNSYTQTETRHFLSSGHPAAGKNADEHQMILNHQSAIEMLATQTECINFNHHTICNLHAIIADNLLTNPAACGRLRQRSLNIPATTYTPIQQPHLLDSRFAQLLTKVSAISDPFEQAFFTLVHLPYLQPFEHLNNNVARLAANIPLTRQNLIPLSFADAPRSDYNEAIKGVYELNRVDYLRDLFVWAYQRSASRYTNARDYLGEPDPFRLKYRVEIQDLVRLVILSAKDATESNYILRQEAGTLFTAELQGKIIDIVEKELKGLHEGNIARYRLPLEQFQKWKNEGASPAKIKKTEPVDSGQLNFDW